MGESGGIDSSGGRTMPKAYSADIRMRVIVMIKNVGTDPVSLSAWILRDQAGATWSLNAAGILNGGPECPWRGARPQL
jgi:hypothetical protein